MKIGLSTETKSELVKQSLDLKLWPETLQVNCKLRLNLSSFNPTIFPAAISSLPKTMKGAIKRAYRLIFSEVRRLWRLISFSMSETVRLKETAKFADNATDRYTKSAFQIANTKLQVPLVRPSRRLIRLRITSGFLSLRLIQDPH